MATPYFQLRLERVPSTQDVARERLAELPVLVLASGQSQGRGRSGSSWLTADRALAASLAWRDD
ncbi:MAG TPA: biotin--[acetyl-CoA-carboxylase] ligase, partial [Acidimicrobiia bacterium]|nr:biotin--[acetyl-CoA-carboxylase] ligase [Acidimicrobiia bacterium]